MGDAVFLFLLKQVIKLVVNERRKCLEFKSNFGEMIHWLEYMPCLLEDLKKKKASSETLNKVRYDLTELIYDAEDIFADYKLLSQNFTKYISRENFEIRDRLLTFNREIEKLLRKMGLCLQIVSNLTSNEKEDENQSSNYPILINEDDIVGFKDDSEKLRKWILGASGPPKVIGIVGPGGIGKTTLAQKIYNKVKNSFMHAAQVIVSRSMKFDQLIREILNELEEKEKHLRGKKIGDLLRMLRDKLDGKYLLLLDDIWGLDEKQWWVSLKSFLPQVNGSCIVVTTRNKGVAKSMASNRRICHLQYLSKDNSWSLFCKVAFAKNKGKCPNRRLESTGRKIVKKCGGLPLAIKVVGGVLLQKDYDVNEWEGVLKNLEQGLAGNQNDDLIISRLKLSYQDLPSYLKPCLLSLALYPEDYNFSSLSFIFHCIGERLISERNGKTAIEIGEEYLVELVNRCLIIVKEKGVFENSIRKWRVHDMVRNMVINIAREENFANLLHKDESSSNTKQCRRVAIYKDTTPTSVTKNTKLRTLLEWDIESTEVISNLNTKLNEFRWLRVLKLKLSSTKVDEHVKNWLSGIGSLRHLICLSIYNSALKILPKSIENLRNLQVFSVKGCPNLERLPSSIASLEKLIVIDVYGCDSLKYWPEGIAKLSNLECLFGLNLTGSDELRISQLKNLTKLRELEVVINYEKQLEEGELNALSMLQHLRYLYIRVGGNCQRAELSGRIDSLQLSPLKRLEELRLTNILHEERTPVWLNPASFPNLRFLYISEGSIKCVGPEFSNSKNGIWKVERLILAKLKTLEAKWSSIRKAMPSLTMLKVQDCPKLKSFPIDVTSRRLTTWRSE